MSRYKLPLKIFSTLLDFVFFFSISECMWIVLWNGTEEARGSDCCIINVREQRLRCLAVWQVIKGDYATVDTERWPNTAHKQTQSQQFHSKQQMLFVSVNLWTTFQSVFWRVKRATAVRRIFILDPFGRQHCVQLLSLIWDIPVLNKGVKGRDTESRPSADGVNPPVLTTDVRAAPDGLARNWVSGIYLSGLSSGPKIVEVISLIPVILLQCCCPLPPCKHDHKLFGPHTGFIYRGSVFLTAADVLSQVPLPCVVPLYCCTGFQRCYCVSENGNSVAACTSDFNVMSSQFSVLSL